MDDKRIFAYFLSGIICFATHGMDHKKILAKSVTVALEGILDDEKSTFAQDILKDLKQRGFDATLIKEPHTETGKINNPELTHNKLILCNRFIHPSIAYAQKVEPYQVLRTQKVLPKTADYTISITLPIETITGNCKRTDLSLNEKEKLLMDFRNKLRQEYPDLNNMIEADEIEPIEEFGQNIEDWLKENHFCS